MRTTPEHYTLLCVYFITVRIGRNTHTEICILATSNWHWKIYKYMGLATSNTNVLVPVLVTVPHSLRRIFMHVHSRL